MAENPPDDSRSPSATVCCLIFITRTYIDTAPVEDSISCGCGQVRAASPLFSLPNLTVLAVCKRRLVVGLLVRSYTCDAVLEFEAV